MTKQKLLTSPRNLPLDVLRGMTIALMITVNNPGSWRSIYPPFMHSEWHGFTLTDLVFPTFLFVVGNALSFTWTKMASLSASDFFKKVLKRTAIIFLIGLLLNYFPFFEFEDGKFTFSNILEVRIWGVLQRIAVCYFLANLLLFHLQKKWLIITGIIILLIYWGILYYFGNPVAPYSLAGNAVKTLDLLIFHPENLYNGFGIPFEPEGLLSTLPATLNVVAGYLAGNFIRNKENQSAIALKLFGFGLTLIVIGQLWHIVFPINKPLWTSSYVLLTIGWHLLILGILILLIEVLNFKKWTYFFVVFGKNPLFIYIISWIIIGILYLIPIKDTTIGSYLYRTFFLSWADDKNASLLFAISYMLLMWLIALVMDKKKIYIKV